MSLTSLSCKALGTFNLSKKYAAACLKPKIPCEFREYRISESQLIITIGKFIKHRELINVIFMQHHSTEELQHHHIAPQH